MHDQTELLLTGESVIIYEKFLKDVTSECGIRQHDGDDTLEGLDSDVTSNKRRLHVTWIHPLWSGHTARFSNSEAQQPQRTSHVR